MSQNFKNIHELLHESAFGFDGAKPIYPRARTIQSFQIAVEDKEKLDQICRTNSSTASAFLRACVAELIKDYE
jgi:hypothetical protein